MKKDTQQDENHREGNGKPPGLANTWCMRLWVCSRTILWYRHMPSWPLTWSIIPKYDMFKKCHKPAGNSRRLREILPVVLAKLPLWTYWHKLVLTHIVGILWILCISVDVSLCLIGQWSLVGLSLITCQDDTWHRAWSWSYYIGLYDGDHGLSKIGASARHCWLILLSWRLHFAGCLWWLMASVSGNFCFVSAV